MAEVEEVKEEGGDGWVCNYGRRRIRDSGRVL